MPVDLAALRGPCDWPCGHRDILAAGATDPATTLDLVGRVEPTPANPRGIAITHRPGAGREDGHHCAPNIVATCSTCAQTVVLCSATAADVDAIKRGVWTCGDCEVGDA